MKGNSMAVIVPLILFLWNTLPAQEAEKKQPEYGWKNEAVGNLNLTQTSFSNWTQGGEDSWTWQLDLNGKFVNDQEKFNWSNTGKISYGKTQIGDAAARKSADEIRFETVFTYKLGSHVNPYIAGTAETQLTSAYDYTSVPKTEISKMFDPAYFTESMGIGYEPVKDLKTRLGLALKQTIADKFALTYSDDPETEKVETLRSEAGVESVTDFSRKLNQIILFTTRLEMFSNLNRFDEVDVRWDNLFSAKVAKYVSVNFNFKLFYDKDISVKRQLKQVLAAGLTYSFI